jgi:hypothetical protein
MVFYMQLSPNQGSFTAPSRIPPSVPSQISADSHHWDKKVAELKDEVERFTAPLDRSKVYQARWSIMRVIGALNELALKAIKFLGDNVPDINLDHLESASRIFTEIRKIEVLSLLPLVSVWVEIYESGHKIAAATKVSERAEAVFGAFAWVKELVRAPREVIDVIALFKEGVEASAKVSQWAPWLSVVSLVASTASIGLQAREQLKKKNFAVKLARKSNEAVIEKFHEKVVLTQKLPEAAKGDFAKAARAAQSGRLMSHLKLLQQEAKKSDPNPTEVEKLRAELLSCFHVDKSQLTSVHDDLEPLMEEWLNGHQDFLAAQKAVDDARQGNSSDLKVLEKVLEGERKKLAAKRGPLDSYVKKQIALLRNERDGVSLAELTTALKENVKGDTKLTVKLEQAANNAFLDALASEKPKTLRRHFKVDPAHLQASIARIKKQAIVGADLTRKIDTLRGRVRQNALFGAVGLTATTISFVASLLFLPLSFGLICSPLAPIGLSLLAAVGLLGIANTIVQMKKRKEFEHASGVTDQRKCADWEKRLTKIQKHLGRANIAEPDRWLAELRDLNFTELEKMEAVPAAELANLQEALEKARDRLKTASKAQLGDHKRSIRRLHKQIQAAEEFNRIQEELQVWSAKRRAI